MVVKGRVSFHMTYPELRQKITRAQWRSRNRISTLFFFSPGTTSSFTQSSHGDLHAGPVLGDNQLTHMPSPTNSRISRPVAQPALSAVIFLASLPFRDSHQGISRHAMIVWGFHVLGVRSVSLCLIDHVERDTCCSSLVASKKIHGQHGCFFIKDTRRFAGLVQQTPTTIAIHRGEFCLKVPGLAMEGRGGQQHSEGMFSRHGYLVRGACLRASIYICSRHSSAVLQSRSFPLI